MRLLERAWRNKAGRHRGGVPRGVRAAATDLDLTSAPKGYQKEAMANVMIAGSNPDVYDELMYRQQRTRCAQVGPTVACATTT